MLGIVITGLVFAIVLAPQVHLTGRCRGRDDRLPLHLTVGCPGRLAAVRPRPRITWATAAAAFVWPVMWLLYIFAQGAFTNWYPYPFLNVVELGLGAAIRNALVVLVLGVLLTVGFKALDAKLPMPGRGNSPPR